MRFPFFLALAAVSLSVQGQLLANFDQFNEGEVFTTFTDDGITFSEVTRHQGGFTNFAIEDASLTLGGAGLSLPNALGFGGYMPGGDAAFGAFGGMTFTTVAEANMAWLDVWALPLDMGGNTVSLIGYKDLQVVDREDHVFGTSFSPLHWRFELAVDTYDMFRLESSGPAVSGDSFLLVDNVFVDAVPEPATLLTLAIALVWPVARRTRR